MPEPGPDPRLRRTFPNGPAMAPVPPRPVERCCALNGLGGLRPTDRGAEIRARLLRPAVDTAGGRPREHGPHASHGCRRPAGWRRQRSVRGRRPEHPAARAGGTRRADLDRLRRGRRQRAAAPRPRLPKRPRPRALPPHRPRARHAAPPRRARRARRGGLLAPLRRPAWAALARLRGARAAAGRRPAHGWRRRRGSGGRPRPSGRRPRRSPSTSSGRCGGASAPGGA
jgi:hypothetical protein